MIMENKKKYQKPTTQIVVLNKRPSLLAGSPEGENPEGDGC